MRFPGFEGEWESFRAESLFAPVVDKNHPQEEVLTIIQGFGTVPRKDSGRIIRFDAASVKTYKKVQKGDFIIHLRSFEGGLEKANEDGIVSPAYTILRSKHPIEVLYYDAYFHTDRFINHVLAKTVEGIRDGRQISYEAFKWLPIPRCQIGEQKKIGKFLSCLDSRITAQRKLVELLKKHKRGVIEQIFGRRLPIGDNPEKWELVKLRDLFKKVVRRNRDGKVKNVITNSAEYGLIPQRNFFDKSIAVDGNTDGYYVIRTGDFVYNPRKSATAPFGPFNRYTGENDGIISPLYTCLVLAGKANPDYLAWYFRSTAWHRHVYDNGSQGARHDRVNMTDDLLFGIPVLLPPGNIQTWIADMLNSINARVSDADKALTQLETMKRGLLQQLFA